MSEVYKVMAYYGDRINFVYKHFPAHKDSSNAAEAAECARDQGKFWEYHDMLFDNLGNLGTSDLAGYAGALSLDMGKFSLCISSREKSAKVQSDFREGVQLGIKGTPTFIVNRIMLTGVQSFEQFRQIIDKEMQNG